MLFLYLILIVGFLLIPIEQITSQSAIISSGGSSIITVLPPINISMPYNPSLTIMYDPPEYSFTPTVLGLFVRCVDHSALIYYDINGKSPTLNSPYATYNSPYIVVNTFFKGSRNRTIAIIAVSSNPATGIKSCSKQQVLRFFVEGSARINSFGFLVPGIESSGYFVRVGLEMVASARATSGGSQEFADFFSKDGKGSSGIGTYLGQVTELLLTDLDPDLIGFEGGFPVNVSINQQYGILVPYHTGKKYFGKVVRIDLKAMDDVTSCKSRFRMESYDANKNVIVTGTASAATACVFVIDLTTIHPLAKGFRKGFVGFPFGYLSAGEFNVLVRLNMANFGITTTKIIDLALVDNTMGGYSGGFTDGTFSCFCPFKSFAGPVGGIRSSLPVDANHLSPYYYSVMVCVNSTVWSSSSSSLSPNMIGTSIFTIDFSIVDVSLRGYSEVIRVGRYAYMAPYASSDHVYSAKLLRIDLGDIDIGHTLLALLSAGQTIRQIIDVLDLSKIENGFRGYSGLYTSANYVFLVPFRNSYEPKFGQRGHGYLTRLNMNDFSITGIDYADLTTSLRDQIPSFQDLNLRGFSAGFASGQYGLLVPFYNADFFGRLARVIGINVPLNTSIQELDLKIDRKRPNTYKGFRGGFASIWQGVLF